MNNRHFPVVVSAITVSLLMIACEGDTTTQQMMSAGPATKLGFGSVPSSLVASTPFTITVRALRDDNSVDDDFTGTVSITKSSGPGTLSGTLMQPVSAGVATFTDLVVDLPGDYTFSATTANLTEAVTSPVTAEPAETVARNGTFISQNGYLTTGSVQVILKGDGSEVLRTGSNFAVSSGAGSIGVWLTNSTGAANLNDTSTKFRLGIITSGFSGMYEYVIPGGLGVYTHVVTFCEGAQTNFGNAELMEP
jgi:hypothetical protein